MSEQKQVAVRDAEVLPAQRRDPLEVLLNAIENPDFDPVKLRLAMELQAQWKADRAREAFNMAMAKAKAEIGVIEKNKHVVYKHKDKGGAAQTARPAPAEKEEGKTDYWHEDLASIAKTVDPILGKYGLSYRWRTTAEPNEPVRVTCVIAHELGHTEENSLPGPRDDSGKKNSIQQMGSTLTYLQRYTLKAALGLAAGRDDDAATAEAEPPASVAPEQITALQTRLRTVGLTEARVLKRFEVEKLEDLTANQYKLANSELDELQAKKTREARAVAQP